MELFICATAYQLLNALIITTQERLNADLMITHRNMSRICDVNELKSSGVFRKVYSWYELTDSVTRNGVKSEADDLHGKLNKLVLYMRKKAIYESLPNREEEYNRVFIGYDEIPSEYIFWWFEKKGASIHLYDDGTYTYKCFEIDPPVYKKLISWILFKDQLLNKCKDVWARNVEAISTGKRKDICIHEIKLENEEIHALVSKIFKGSFDPNQFNTPIIFLDQYFTDEICDTLQKQTVSLITKEFGSKAITVKLHPSTDGDKYEPKVAVIKTKVPFELFVDSIDIENKILIALYSTACFTPKLVFDREPLVLFLDKLGKLNNGRMLNQQYLDAIAELKASYYHKDRVLEIGSLQELMDVIKVRLKREELVTADESIICG